MMWHKAFTITGVANTETLDTGIESTATEKRKVRSVLVYVSGAVGNKIQVWLNQTKLTEIYDYFFITEESTGAANVQKAVNRRDEIPIEIDLKVGDKLKVGLSCGGTTKNLFGSYAYEVM